MIVWTDVTKQIDALNTAVEGGLEKLDESLAKVIQDLGGTPTQEQLTSAISTLTTARTNLGTHIEAIGSAIDSLDPTIAGGAISPADGGDVGAPPVTTGGTPDGQGTDLPADTTANSGDSTSDGEQS